MPGVYLRPELEEMLEWIVLLSTMSSCFCVLALLSIVIFGKWRRAASRREQVRRRSV